MNSKRNYIAFDQYQRYKTIARIIEFHRIGNAERFRVLELGSNEHKDLKLFLPKDQILFTDIDLTETMRNDPEFQQVDATSLPFDDLSFDFVIAADVFEHIEPGKRQCFLTETYRVASRGVILSFPHDARYVIDAEDRINTYYKSISGEDFIWLKEHSINGLPKIKSVNEFLDSRGYQYFFFFHGTVKTWEKMWYCHFNTVFMPETLEYREKIDYYYNTYLYQNDVSDECYRAFYVLSHTPIDLWEKNAAGFWNTEDSKTDDFLDTLLEAQKSLHTLYEKNRLQRDLFDIVEASATIADLKGQLLRASEGIEDRDCQLSAASVEIADLKEQLLRASEGKQGLVQEHEEEKQGLVQQYEEEKQGLMRQHEEEKQELVQQYEEEKRRLAQQLAQVQDAYSVISNAFFWKITKPFRMVVDRLKSLLRRNHFIWLVCKGFRCLEQNGFRYTWDKLQGYYRHNAQYQDNIENVITEDEGTHINLDGPKFSILVPLYNTSEKLLREMIESVLCQTYENWELCLADGSIDNHVEEICAEYVQRDCRIHYRRLEKNLGISGNSNICAQMADGEFLVLLDHDDLLAPHALRENVRAILETQADILYSDEDHITWAGKHKSPFFKPDWSPDLLYCQMYICHLLVFRRELFFEAGGFRSQFDGSQDYDLVLRMSEHTERICHIPEILYLWRECENSTASGAEAKPYAYEAGKKALEEHLERKYGIGTWVEECGFSYNARFPLSIQPLVSIIIPMKDKHEMTADCIKSILEKSSYHNFEILLLDNRSEEEQTKRWLRDIASQDDRIRIITADMEFNWSKLNNFGVSHAKGDIFIFLNNDTLVISEDWIERLSENVLRDEIGVVGPLLLYPDGEIQHAGVVVGMGGWADHVYKGLPLKNYCTPYVSPTVSRNVLAVTGACMAVSRKSWEDIGTFDEEFVICGSDVEYAIRAYEKGLFNRYDANVRLYHLESKSRDTYIPDIDFKKSYVAYTPYRENVDPFFNINLDTTSVVPKENIANMNLINFKNFLKRCPVTEQAYQKVKKALMPPNSYIIPEITAVTPRKSSVQSGASRLNLLLPTIDRNHIFGGISTAMKFFEELQKHRNGYARIIVLDSSIDLKTAMIPDGYVVVSDDQDDEAPLQLLSIADRRGKTFPVWENDIFIATAWWSAYVIADTIRWQSDIYHVSSRPLIYFIQDYEPGFYPWSSRYLMADSTYRLDIPTLAVVNTSILEDFFKKNQYSFEKVWSFEPQINDSLRKFLPQIGQRIPKRKQILIYGRPTVDRNAFELIIYAMKIWVSNQPDLKEWTLISAGEKHEDVDLGYGAVLHSVGKLTLENYAAMLLETYAGISLMVSPHPSYPPLEMAAFGVQTITNCYANKNLTSFSENIISVDSCGPKDIASELGKICNRFSGFGYSTLNSAYIEDNQVFSKIIPDILERIE